MVELATRTFVDFGVDRKYAILGVCGFGFLFGVPSALNLDFFANQDFVWGIGLLISGALVATAVISYGVRDFRIDAIASIKDDRDPGRVWEVLVGVLVPMQAVVLLGWWLWQSAAVYAPDSWFNPLEPFSVMTCLLQWGLAIVIFLALNKQMARRTLGRTTEVE